LEKVEEGDPINGQICKQRPVLVGHRNQTKERERENRAAKKNVELKKKKGMD
jgi:hypothetical protein